MPINKIKSLQEALGNYELIADFFPGSSNHYLGVSKRNEVILFINSKNPLNENYGASDGRYLYINYSVDCEFTELETKNLIKENFTVIRLKNQNKEDSLLNKFFINLCSVIISELGETPLINKVNAYIEKIKLLFTKLIVRTNLTELGLWGELFIIATSKEPEYLIQSWHINKTDKFDFNDGQGKLEIKTTTKGNRIHHFSLEQLNQQSQENTLVGSIMTSEINLGLSVSDLCDIIIEKIGVNGESMKLFTDKLFNVAGSDLDSFCRKFDFSTAKMQTLYFLPNDIPSIKPECISLGVSEIKFASNLEQVKNINIQSYSDKKLFSKLG